MLRGGASSRADLPAGRQCRSRVVELLEKPGSWRITAVALDDDGQLGGEAAELTQQLEDGSSAAGFSEMDSNFLYGDTRAPKAEASRASRVARAPERAMLAAGCTTVIAGAPSHRGFVQFASAIAMRSAPCVA